MKGKNMTTRMLDELGKARVYFNSYAKKASDFMKGPITRERLKEVHESTPDNVKSAEVKFVDSKTKSSGGVTGYQKGDDFFLNTETGANRIVFFGGEKQQLETLKMGRDVSIRMNYIVGKVPVTGERVVYAEVTGSTSD